MTGFGAAVAVHIGLLAVLLLPKAPGVRSLFQADDRASLTISLVRLPSTSVQPPSPEQAERDRLDALSQTLAGPEPSSDPKPPPRPEADTAAILQTFDLKHETSHPAAKPAQTARMVPAAAGGGGDDPYARASVPAPDQLAPRSSSLWPQLQRCWKPERTFPPVKLSVTLDAQGGLSEPPSVVRDPAAGADPQRLRAEAEAVRAVIACAPYVVAGGAPRSFELAFAG